MKRTRVDGQLSRLEYEEQEASSAGGGFDSYVSPSVSDDVSGCRLLHTHIRALAAHTHTQHPPRPKTPPGRRRRWWRRGRWVWQRVVPAGNPFDAGDAAAGEAPAGGPAPGVFGGGQGAQHALPGGVVGACFRIGWFIEGLTPSTLLHTRTGVRGGLGAEGARGEPAGERAGVPGLRAAHRGALPPPAGGGLHGALLARVASLVCMVYCTCDRPSPFDHPP